MASSVNRAQAGVDLAQENKRSIAVALALSVLTLATFAAAAGRGPESAVKKFHEAIKENDAADLARVLAQPEDNADSVQLAGLVSQLLSVDPHVELGKVQSAGQTASIDVIYNRGRYGRQAVRFVIVQKSSHWVIDAQKTLDLYRRPFGL